MRTVLIGVAVLGACAIAAVTWIKSSTFGPSRTAPLGERRLIDAWLADAGFQPCRVNPDRLPAARDDGRRELQLEHRYPDMLARGSEAALVENPDGSMYAVTARFASGKEEVHHPGPRGAKAEIFAFTLWKDLAGQLPEFRSEIEGAGRTARQRLVATFARNGAKGRWVKTYDSNGDARTIWDTVLFSKD